MTHSRSGAHLCDRVNVEDLHWTGLNLDSVLYQNCERLGQTDRQTDRFNFKLHSHCLKPVSVVMVTMAQ